MNEITFNLYEQNLARYYREGKFPEALKQAKESLDFSRRAFGPRHPNTAEALTSYALLLQASGNPAAAEPFQREALAVWRRDPKFFRETASAYDSLGMIYQAAGKFRKAEVFHKKAYKIRKNMFGAGDSSVAACLNNLASLYGTEQQFEKAERYYLKAISIWEQNEEYNNLAKGLNNLAVLYQDQEQYEKALPLLERALDLKKEIYGRMHPQVATSLYNLAGIYAALGRLAEAENCYREALTIWQLSLEPGHAYIASAQQRLSQLSARQSAPAASR